MNTHLGQTNSTRVVAVQSFERLSQLSEKEKKIIRIPWKASCIAEEKHVRLYIEDALYKYIYMRCAYVRDISSVLTEWDSRWPDSVLAMQILHVDCIAKNLGRKNSGKQRYY